MTAEVTGGPHRGAALGPARALSRRGFARIAALTGVAAVAVAARENAASAAPSIPNPARTSVVYVPHQDDDVLGFGLYIASQTMGGNDVHVVLYTDGSGTGVCLPDEAHASCQQNNEFHDRPVEEFVAERDAEFVASCLALGVPEANIHIGTPGIGRARDAQTTIPYADQVLRYWIERFPRATHVTYSWIDTNPDHSYGGRALRAIVAAGALPATQALFAIARWYWQYDYPGLDPMFVTRRNELRAAQGYPLAAHMFKTTHGPTNDCFHDAIEAYKVPSNIGYRSTPLYIDVADADPSSLLHGYASARYPTRLTARAQLNLPRTRLQVSGSLRYLDFPGYGDLSNAVGLAQALDTRLVPDAMSNALVRLEVVDRSGRVLTSTSTRARADGRFAAAVPLPRAVRIPVTGAGASVRVKYNGSTGAAPTTLTVGVGGPQTRPPVTPKPLVRR